MHIMNKLYILPMNENHSKEIFMLQKENLRDFGQNIWKTEELKDSIKNHDVVAHFAANADVRYGVENTKKDLEQKLKTLEWTQRPHNLVVTGLPLTAFKRLFPLAEGKEYHNQSFSRATLRQWSDHLSQSHRKYRLRIMNNPTWTDGILTTTMLLMELCNRSFKDSFIMSDGELALGILASLPSSEND